MPSFDVVSEVDKHELSNALDQTRRELETRFDFRGVDARVEQDDMVISLQAPSEFQLLQLRDILRAKLAARKIDLRAVDESEPDVGLSVARQTINLKQGIDQATGKKLGALLRDAKLKVQSQINGDKLRVTGKKRDDLQAAIAVLRKAELDLPLQFENFRD